VLSLDPDAFKFRKLAVDAQYRRRGIASALIDRAHNVDATKPLVCDARLDQADFYRNRGFQANGEPFLKYPKDAPHSLYLTMLRPPRTAASSCPGGGDVPTSKLKGGNGDDALVARGGTDSVDMDPASC